MNFLGTLHPKVSWPLLINTILTVLAAVTAAWQSGGRAAALTAVIGGGVTILGAVTGYAVSSPPPGISLPVVTSSGYATPTITTTV